jgi:uncharacterized membrane protein
VISKTITWRVTASLITIAIVYFLTNDFLLAFAVIGIELISKLVIYYIHEKLWSFTNKPAKGTQFRSAVKTLTWRFVASLDTLLILFVVTKEPFLATSGASIEVVAKSLFYYLHERIWNKYRLDEEKVVSSVAEN